MTFDDNSTRQHFKGVLVSLVTPNEADWYVYCLHHVYTHKKVAHRNLPTGNLYGFVVQSEDLLAARWNIPLSDDYKCKHCVSQRPSSMSCQRCSTSIKHCKDKNYFSFRNGLFALFNKKVIQTFRPTSSSNHHKYAVLHRKPSVYSFLEVQVSLPQPRLTHTNVACLRTCPFV